MWTPLPPAVLPLLLSPSGVTPLGQQASSSLSPDLLEKSRVIFPAARERRLHAYYQILSGKKPGTGR